MPGETKAIAGYKGEVYIGTVSSVLKAVCEIGHWTGAISRDLIDVPKFDVDKHRIYGKRDFSGSFDGSWYANDKTGQKVLQDALLSDEGTTIYLKLQADDDKWYSCWALISGEALDVAHEGAQTINFDFSSSGKIAVEYTSATA